LILGMNPINELQFLVISVNYLKPLDGAVVGRRLLILGIIQIDRIQFLVILESGLTLYEQTSLKWPSVPGMSAEIKGRLDEGLKHLPNFVPFLTHFSPVCAVQ
jgi:hypothetical protein